MALIKGGKLFYIPFGPIDYKDKNGTVPSAEQYLQWALNQYTSILKIKDPNYLKVNYDSNHNPYFLFPYINKNTKDKFGLIFQNFDTNYDKGSSVHIALQFRNFFSWVFFNFYINRQ